MWQFPFLVQALQCTFVSTQPTANKHKTLIIADYYARDWLERAWIYLCSILYLHYHDSSNDKHARDKHARAFFSRPQVPPNKKNCG